MFVTQRLLAFSSVLLWLLPRSRSHQDCGECPTAFTTLVLPGTIQAEDFDLGGEVRELSLRRIERA